MGLIEKTIELVIGIFIIILFATTVFPALAEATGQNLTWVTIVLGLLIIALIVGFLKTILR